MSTSFSGGRSRSTRREPPTMGKQLVNVELKYIYDKDTNVYQNNLFYTKSSSSQRGSTVLYFRILWASECAKKLII